MSWLVRGLGGVGCALVCISLVAADQPVPSRAPLAEPGAVLFQDDFAAAKLGETWKIGVGAFQLQDGVLQGKELPQNNHVAVVRAAVPLQDAVVSLKFKLDGAKGIHLGFDPCPGELKRKGHLFAVVVSPEGVVVNKAPDKSDPKSKPMVMIKSDLPVAVEKWHTLVVTLKGNHVSVLLDNVREMRAEDAELHVKKPGIILRVLGESASFDDVQVRAAK